MKRTKLEFPQFGFSRATFQKENDIPLFKQTRTQKVAKLKATN